MYIAQSPYRSTSAIQELATECTNMDDGTPRLLSNSGLIWKNVKTSESNIMNTLNLKCRMQFQINNTFCGAS